MICPTSEAELAEAIGGSRGPLWLRGGGSRIAANPDCDVLDTSGLSGVVAYEPGALTLVAKAGTPVAEIAKTLAAEGQRLAFEPMDLRVLMASGGTPTIGGVVATNASGPRRVQVGACRDFLLGVRFVDGRGTVLKNGGRVMKNVTGYDLVKLMCGSHGTLGALSEVAFKVLPVPEMTATVTVHGPGEQDAVRVMSQALGSPFEISGAAYNPLEESIYLRLEGFENSVSYRAGRVRELLAVSGDISVETDQGTVAKTWEDIRDVAAFSGQPGDVWRLSVSPSNGPDIASKLGHANVMYDWGGGLMWVLTPEGTDLRAMCGEFAGHATLIRGADATRARLSRFHPEAPPLANISRRLREQFDPKSILNPGFMG